MICSRQGIAQMTSMSFILYLSSLLGELGVAVRDVRSKACTELTYNARGLLLIRVAHRHP